MKVFIQTINMEFCLETFQNYISPFSKFIWKPNGNNPPLNQVRGKIVFLIGFNAANNLGI